MIRLAFWPNLNVARVCSIWCRPGVIHRIKAVRESPSRLWRSSLVRGEFLYEMYLYLEPAALAAMT